mgnify:CR=1 FL=1
MMLLVLVCKAFQVDTSLYFEYVEATLDANPLLLFRIQPQKAILHVYQGSTGSLDFKHFVIQSRST